MACPVCLSHDGENCEQHPFGIYDAYLYECDICGRFVVSRTAVFDWLGPDSPRLSFKRRAILSHQIRIRSGGPQQNDMWTTDRLQNLFDDDPRLPTPAQQATNIIRFIGDETSETGVAIEMPPRYLGALIGLPSLAFAFELFAELKDRQLVSAMTMETMQSLHVQDLKLTLAGWDIYEQERHGETAGNYGFIALKFGDRVLDPLVRDHIKPAVRDIGFDLIDLRDVSRAGVIDNILRVKIRDSAFVLVDLTHENAGAYWEAGYAEGLGKPVLYLCERAKFDEKQTHFDTNHCTTVLWDVDQIEEFKDELVATLKRTLSV